MCTEKFNFRIRRVKMSEQESKTSGYADVEVFINEDLSSNENRLNVALFHLLMIDEIKEFLMAELNILNKDAVILPSTNVDSTSYRPDFKVIKLENNNEIPLGYIEVELGKENKEQLDNYKELLKTPAEKLYSIVGKTSDLKSNKKSADDITSLEKIKDKAAELLSKESISQRYFSLRTFEKMVEEFVFNKKVYNSQGRTQISQEVENSLLVQSLKKFFRNKVGITYGEIKSRKQGNICLDTTIGGDGKATAGLSLKIKGQEQWVSMMSIHSNFDDFLVIPSMFLNENSKGKKSLEKYFFPEKKKHIEAYVNLAKINSFKPTSDSDKVIKILIDSLLKKENEIIKFWECLEKIID